MVNSLLFSMAGPALYRKWRPKSFEEVLGQEHVTQTLKNALASGRTVHAYLFSGPRGTGKTTTARILAKGLNCLGPEEKRPDNSCVICQSIDQGRSLDLIEIDAASHGLVDDARDLVEKVKFTPGEARYKVYIIDEVHMLSTAASNALLKTLEEPPPHAYFILATTEPHKVLPTILSRCQRFDFRPLPLNKIMQRLKWIAGQEGFKIEEEALELIARQANGSMRDGDSLLDQVASGGAREVTLVQVQAILGSVSPQAVSSLVENIARQNLAEGLQIIGGAVREGADPRQLARQVIEYLRGVLLLKVTGQDPPQVTPEVAQEMARLGQTLSLEKLSAAIRNFQRASWDFKASLPPELPLELAFVDSVLLEGQESAVAETTPPKKKPAATSRGSARQSPAKNQPPPSALSPRGNNPHPPAGAEGDWDVESFEILKSHWEEFMGVIRAKSMHVEALLKSGEPVGVKRDKVVLGFYYPFHKGQIENARNREVVVEALQQIMGRAVGVQCVLIQERAPEQAERKASPASEDPVIRVAREMGAEVAPVTDGGGKEESGDT